MEIFLYCSISTTTLWLSLLPLLMKEDIGGKGATVVSKIISTDIR